MVAAYINPPLTRVRLLDILDYDFESGIFRWKTKRRRVAGCIMRTGYRVICIDGVIYLAHRLAWLYSTGEWPKEQIDHVDMNKDNNAFANLREATNSQNHQNKRSKNASGLKGVSKSNGGTYKNPYMARIKLNQKTIYLGTFATAEEAHTAYCNAAKTLFGEFARPECV